MTRTAYFTVEGMSCDGCARIIQKTLSQKNGIESVAVSYPTKMATVQSAFSDDIVGKLIADMGYDVAIGNSQPEVHEPIAVPTNSAKDRKKGLPTATPTAYRPDSSGIELMAREPVEMLKPAFWGTFLVEGMSCASCAAGIEKALRDRNGVVEATVNFATSTAAVHFYDHLVGIDAIEKFIGSMGYQATFQGRRITNEKTVTFTIEGMTCASRAAELEKVLSEADEVLSVTVNFATCTATVQYNVTRTNPNDIQHVIVRLGYTAVISQKGKQGPLKSEADAIFIISGMSCASCAAGIEKRLVDHPGVVQASVNFATCTAAVKYYTQTTNITTLADVIAGGGYSITSQTHSGRDIRSNEETLVCYVAVIENMACATCATRIECVLCAMTGVLRCDVQFATAIGKFTLDTSVITLDKIVQRIESMGFSLVVSEDTPEAADTTQYHAKEALRRTSEIRQQKLNFYASLSLSIPLFAVMLIMSFSTILHSPRVRIILDGVMWGLATPVAWFGRQFFSRAWRSVLHGSFTMDTLIVMGVGCSYVFSVVSYILLLVEGRMLRSYFETAATLMTFMLLGRFLEAVAKKQTSAALIQLMSLAPPTALVIEDGVDRVVPSPSVVRGMLLRVLAGSRVPVDGVVTEGASDIDTQMVTGEPVPRPVQAGSAVVGGTLNVTSVLVMRATRVGEETMLSQILRIVQEAQITKPAIQRVADRMAGVFVPIVMAYALLVLAVWLALGLSGAYPPDWLTDAHEDSPVAFAFTFFIAATVAACPCALGLAAPTAIMVGTGVGAQLGILVKSGSALETVRSVDCVVFDKTGTITKGKLEVVWLQRFEDEADSVGVREEMFGALGVVEQQSSHPVAQAVAKAIVPAGGVGGRLRVGRSTTHGGLGVEALVTSAARGRAYCALVGNVEMMRRFGVPVSEEVAGLLAARHAEGRTTVIGAVDGRVVLLAALADEPKPESAGVVAALRRRGVRSLMVTGDDAGVARRVALAVGMAPGDVHAEARPARKAEIVRALQRAGRRVAFVGDGINDTPALAQADVGVALGAGAEVAIDAADVVLVQNSLVDLLNLIKLSRSTVNRIYGNFVWALVYNLAMLPIASGIFFPVWRYQLPPWMAGVAMITSSLSVLASSLLLSCFTPYKEEDILQPQ